MSPVKWRSRHSQADTLGLIVDNPRSMAAEAYRTLRTNVQFYNVAEPMRRLLFTSATPREGKSITAANLAIAFAQADKKVIIIDADLRRPNLHRIFQISNQVGLTDVLLGTSDLASTLVSTVVPGLLVLPAGPLPPNPAEMRGLLDELNKEADLVIIDSPPVVIVTDAAVLAPLADGVILVVAAGEVNREVVQQAKSQLEAVRARVLGIVLNGVEDKAKSHDSYYY